MKSSIRNTRNAIVLLDFNNQVWRNHHATERNMQPNSDGIHTGSIVGLSKTLMHAINKAKEHNSFPTLVICEDRTPIRKRKLYEKYKDAFKDYGFKESNGNPILYKGKRKSKDLDYDPVEICREFLSCIPHTRIWHKGEEADDVLASYIFDHECDQIFLYSSDRDMWQLLDKFYNLTIFFDQDGNSPDKEVMMKKFNTTSYDKIPLHKMIRGDSGDNVKSIRNYPFKRSIEAWKKCDSSIESYLHYIIKIYGKDSNFIKKLLQLHNIRLLELNHKLVTLRTDLNYEVEVIKKPDYEKWKHLCYVFETPSLLRAKLMEIF